MKTKAKDAKQPTAAALVAVPKKEAELEESRWRADRLKKKPAI
jgi:hypothetical protein